MKYLLIMIILICPSFLHANMALKEQALNAAKNGKYDIALKQMNEARESLYVAGDSTNYGNALAETGGIYYLMQDYEEATKYYIQSLFYSQADNDSEKTSKRYLFIAECFHSLELYQKSKNYYNNLYYLAIKDVNYSYLYLALMGKATIARHEGNFKDAIHWYEIALEYNTNDSNLDMLHNNIGIAHLVQDNFVEAKEHFAKALNECLLQNKYNPNIYLNLAEYYFRRDSTTIAKIYLDSVDVTNSRLKDIVFSKYELKIKISQTYEQKKALINKALQLASTNKMLKKHILAFSMLATLYDEHHKYKESSIVKDSIIKLKNILEKHNNEASNLFVYKIDKLERNNILKSLQLHHAEEKNLLYFVSSIALLISLCVTIYFCVVLYRKNKLISTQLAALHDIHSMNHPIKDFLHSKYYENIAEDRETEAVFQLIKSSEKINNYEHLLNNN